MYIYMYTCMHCHTSSGQRAQEHRDCPRERRAKSMTQQLTGSRNSLYARLGFRVCLVVQTWSTTAAKYNRLLSYRPWQIKAALGSSRTTWGTVCPMISWRRRRRSNVHSGLGFGLLGCRAKARHPVSSKP